MYVCQLKGIFVNKISVWASSCGCTIMFRILVYFSGIFFLIFFVLFVCYLFSFDFILVWRERLRCSGQPSIQDLPDIHSWRHPFCRILQKCVATVLHLAYTALLFNPTFLTNVDACFLGNDWSQAGSWVTAHLQLYWTQESGEQRSLTQLWRSRNALPPRNQ